MFVFIFGLILYFILLFFFLGVKKCNGNELHSTMLRLNLKNWTGDLDKPNALGIIYQVLFINQHSKIKASAQLLS